MTKDIKTYGSCVRLTTKVGSLRIVCTAALMAAISIPKALGQYSDHLPPANIQGPVWNGSMDQLRYTDFFSWVVRRCSTATIVAYGEHWKVVSPSTMNLEMAALQNACIVAIMPFVWSQSEGFRKEAITSYQAARAGDPTFPPPNFHNSYGIH